MNSPNQNILPPFSETELFMRPLGERLESSPASEIDRLHALVFPEQTEELMRMKQSDPEHAIGIAIAAKTFDTDHADFVIDLSASQIIL